MESWEMPSTRERASDRVGKVVGACSWWVRKQGRRFMHLFNVSGGEKSFVIGCICRLEQFSSAEGLFVQKKHT